MTDSTKPSLQEPGPALASGPWMLDKYDALDLGVWRHIVRAQATRVIVASVYGDNDGEPPKHAYLIAAAPELLVTLKDLLAHLRRITLDPGDDEEDAPALVAAEALVAKAEGRQP